MVSKCVAVPLANVNVCTLLFEKSIDAVADAIVILCTSCATEPEISIDGESNVIPDIDFKSISSVNANSEPIFTVSPFTLVVPVAGPTQLISIRFVCASAPILIV